jgi:hypothetical protein
MMVSHPNRRESKIPELRRLDDLLELDFFKLLTIELLILHIDLIHIEIREGSQLTFKVGLMDPGCLVRHPIRIHIFITFTLREDTLIFPLLPIELFHGFGGEEIHQEIITIPIQDCSWVEGFLLVDLRDIEDPMETIFRREGRKRGIELCHVAPPMVVWLFG